MLILVPALQAWILRFGWRSGFLFLAGLTAVLLIPLNGFLQRPGPGTSGRFLKKEDHGPTPNEDRKTILREESLWALLKTSHFWYVFWVFFAGGFSVQAILIHQMAIAAESGFDTFLAATVFGIIGFLGTFTRTVWGMVSDRIGRRKTYPIAYLIITLGIGFLLAATLLRSLTVLYGYSLFFGLGYGAIATLNMAMAADRFAGNRFGIIYGFLFLGTSLGSAIGPFVWGMIFDRFSSYTIAILTPPVTLFLSWMAIKRIYGNPPASSHGR